MRRYPARVITSEQITRRGAPIQSIEASAVLKIMMPAVMIEATIRKKLTLTTVFCRERFLKRKIDIKVKTAINALRTRYTGCDAGVNVASPIVAKGSMHEQPIIMAANKEKLIASVELPYCL